MVIEIHYAKLKAVSQLPIVFSLPFSFCPSALYYHITKSLKQNCGYVVDTSTKVIFSMSRSSGQDSLMLEQCYEISIHSIP